MNGRKACFLSFFLVLFLFPLSLYPATDAKTVDFLRKLNRYYYSLRREGLKRIVCEATLTVSPEYKSNFTEIGLDQSVADALDGQKLKIFISVGKKPELRWVAPTSPIPNVPQKKLEDQVQKAIGDLEDSVTNWYAATFEEYLPEKSIKDGDWSITKIGKHFMVSQRDSDGVGLSMMFDDKAKQYHMSLLKNGWVFLSAETDFNTSPQGFLISKMSAIVSSKDYREITRYSYRNVGKFFLLKSLVHEVQFGKAYKKGSSLTLKFNDYVLGE